MPALRSSVITSVTQSVQFLKARSALVGVDFRPQCRQCAIRADASSFTDLGKACCSLVSRSVWCSVWRDASRHHLKLGLVLDHKGEGMLEYSLSKNESSPNA